MQYLDHVKGIVSKENVIW